MTSDRWCCPYHEYSEMKVFSDSHCRKILGKNWKVVWCPRSDSDYFRIAREEYSWLDTLLGMLIPNRFKSIFSMFLDDFVAFRIMRAKRTMVGDPR